jgi:hypothetical protein
MAFPGEQLNFFADFTEDVAERRAENCLLTTAKTKKRRSLRPSSFRRRLGDLRSLLSRQTTGARFAAFSPPLARPGVVPRSSSISPVAIRMTPRCRSRRQGASRLSGLGAYLSAHIHGPELASLLIQID